ncbi:MAG: hypothetical protein ACK45B_04705 [Limisphaerales bacterium]
MRNPLLHIPLMLITVSLFTGCGAKEDHPSAAPGSEAATSATPPPVAPPDPVDLSRFIAAFAQADPAIKLYADETVAVIRARAFRDAAEQLQKLGRNPKLNAEQRQATQELLGRLGATGALR